MFLELITELLQEGYKVNFSAPGHSMYPTIMANETIMVEPIDPGTVRLGDIVLYRTNSRLVAHRVIGIENEINDFVLRGDASLTCDASVKSEQILGKVISIERNGCSIDPYNSKHTLSRLERFWAIRSKRIPRMISSVFSSFCR